MKTNLYNYILELADNCLIAGQRLALAFQNKYSNRARSESRKDFCAVLTLQNRRTRGKIERGPSTLR